MTDVLTRDQDFWERYLNERTGTYDFRCRRYSAVFEVLVNLGLQAHDSVCDVGCGRQEFARFLHEQGWRGEYLPVDGSIDGTDLDVWEPRCRTDWLVAIEVVEHVYRPDRLITAMTDGAAKGITLTTPNPETVDVLAIDRTHVSVIWPSDLESNGLEWKRATLFGDPVYRKESDSLVAWRKHVR